MGPDEPKLLQKHGSAVEHKKFVMDSNDLSSCASVDLVWTMYEREKMRKDRKRKKSIQRVTTQNETPKRKQQNRQAVMGNRQRRKMNVREQGYL